MSAVSFATSFATPLASSLAGGETVVWKGLVFTSLGTSTVYLDNIGGNNPNCEYSTNSGSTWVTFPTTGPALQFTGSLWVRGVNASGFNSSSSAYSVFVFNGSSINASGSVMSLIDGVGDSLVIPNDYCFYSLFKNCLQLTSAPELPATTLTTCCYHSMFRDCGGLTSTPNLPAINLADACYESMFYHCIVLTTATALPATTVLGSSYKNMFNGCTSLVNPPAISAQIVSGYSCLSMFEGCTALTYAPNLPATTLAEGCYERMFFGCSSLTSAMATLPATTLAAECYIHMFNQCGSLTTAPTLPATTLANYCYYQMFASCSSLNEIHCSATDITATGCTGYWTLGVAADGDFYGKSAAGWTTGYDGIPTNWTVHYPFTDFQEVQYLESNGNQHINTGFLFTEDLAKVKFKFESTVSGNTYYEYRLGGTYDGSNRSPMLYNSYPTPYIGLGGADIPTSFSIPSLGFTQDVEVDIDNGSYSYTFNGVTETGTYSGSIVTALSYLLFCCNDNNIPRYNVSGKLYNFSISKGSTLQLNLIPCYRKSDSVAGMYDSVNQIFYTNQGTDSFITGPDVNA